MAFTGGICLKNVNSAHDFLKCYIFVAEKIAQFMIGREKEQKEMERLLKSEKGEMLAIIGRRRVGKTYLVKQVFAKQMTFNIIGVQHGTSSEQLNNFSIRLKDFFGEIAPKKRPKNWLDAFEKLKTCLLIAKTKSKQKKVLFFDEVPWLAETTKSKFVEALAYFWNNWAQEQNLIIVLCGSASSWMIKNLIVTKGGLHNRITKMIHLQPFSLQETQLMLQSIGLNYDPHQLSQVYMTFGGIPHYLNQLIPGKSAAEQIQDLCFSRNSLFKVEFDNLYYALFSGAERHLKVVRTLHTKWKGLTRSELLKTLNLSDGGNFSQVINDLVKCDFILELQDFRNKKNLITYRLIDEFSIFYLSFIEDTSNVPNTYWHNMITNKVYQTWCGYAFENLCFRHQNQIIKALELQAIHTAISSYTIYGNEEMQGIQIDMLIDRADGVINLIEIKYHNEPYIITKNYDLQLRTRMAIFRNASKTRKTIFTSMISVYGTVPNQYSQSLLAHDISLVDLF